MFVLWYLPFTTRFLPAPCWRASEACSACPVTKEEVHFVHAAGMALVVAVVGHLPLFSCPTSTVLLLSTTCTDFLAFHWRPSKAGMESSYLSFCVFNIEGGEHKFAVYVMQSGCSLERILSLW